MTRVNQLLSASFPNRDDKDAIYELLARELHPIVRKIKDAVNAISDDSSGLETRLDAAESDIDAIEAELVTVAADILLKASKALNIITEPDATHDLAAEDADSYVRCTHASGCTVDIDSGVFSLGQIVHFRGVSGQLTLVEGVGVTIHKAASVSLVTREAGSPLMLACVASDGSEFDLFGDMEIP
jgi:hypothetical protein